MPPTHKNQHSFSLINKTRILTGYGCTHLQVPALMRQGYMGSGLLSSLMKPGFKTKAIDRQLKITSHFKKADNVKKKGQNKQVKLTPEEREIIKGVE